MEYIRKNFLQSIKMQVIILVVFRLNESRVADTATYELNQRFYRPPPAGLQQTAPETFLYCQNAIRSA